MEYKGEVYARIGGKYIACTQTVEDLENEIKELKSQLEAQKQVKNNLVLADVIKSVCDHNKMSRKKEVVCRCGKCGEAWFTE